MLSIVELIIGLSFAIKIFSSDITSSGGLSDFIGDILFQASDGASSVFGDLPVTGPLTFLISIAIFMLFSFTLLSQVPRIVKQSRRDLEIEMDG